MGIAFAKKLGLQGKFETFLETADEKIEMPIFSFQDILNMDQNAMKSAVTFKIQWGMNQLRKTCNLSSEDGLTTIPWNVVQEDGYFTFPGLKEKKFCASPHPYNLKTNVLKNRSQWKTEEIRIFLLSKLTFYEIEEEHGVNVGGYMWDPE